MAEIEELPDPLAEPMKKEPMLWVPDSEELPVFAPQELVEEWNAYKESRADD